MMMKFLSCLFFLTTCLTVDVFGQEKLTLQHADELFQKNNLELLASQYNLSSAQAQEIQAKIWDLPYLTGEVNLYNPNNRNYFDVGKSGQKAVAVQQLIYLGGKKRNEVEFAKSNTELAKLYFEQLLISLKLQLHQNFYTLFFDNVKLERMNNQIEKIENLLSNYIIQSNKGNVSLKDVVRLQSLLLNLKNDYNQLLSDVVTLQSKIKLLTGTDKEFNPQVEGSDLDKYKHVLYQKDSLKTMALINNVDCRISKKFVENQDLYLRWQKSLSTPDLTLGVAYDQRGGAFNNQVNLTLGMPLRIRNKNKGNIKIAENELLMSKINLDLEKNKMYYTIDNAYTLWQQYKNHVEEMNTKEFQDIEIVYKGVVDNFEKKNISLLEFSDFMESYNLTNIQINEIKKMWIVSSLELEKVVNYPIYNLKK